MENESSDPTGTRWFGRRLSRRRLLVSSGVAGLGLVSLAIVGCGDDDDDGGGGDGGGEGGGSVPEFDGDTLVWAHTGGIDHVNPARTSAQGISYAAYEHLVNYKMGDVRSDGMVEWVGGGEVQPELAESWEIDGAEVTFHLREGVKFYPSGNEMTADDVLWSFQRALGSQGSFGRSNGVFANLYDADEQIEVLDKYTVKFTFRDADGNPQLHGASMQSLAFYMFPIYDSLEGKRVSTNEEGDMWAEAFTEENTLGTGPYYISSWTQGVELVLEYVGDDSYWGEAPYFKRVILRQFQNFSDVVSLMKQGDVHGMAGMPIAELENLEEAGMQVIHQDTARAVRYFAALDHPQLSNKLVRQALAYAIPYEQIVEGIFAGKASRSLSLMNPKDPTYKPVLERYEYDLVKAKELLTQSGVELPFDLTIFYASGRPDEEDVSLTLQDAWTELGINVSVSGQPTAQFNQARRERINAVTAGEPTDVMVGIIMNTSAIFLDDPQAVVEFWLASTSAASTNASGFNNAEVDSIHAEWGARGDDPAGRAEAYGRLQEIYAEELPMHEVALLGIDVVLAPGLKGYAFVADAAPRYWSLKA